MRDHENSEIISIGKAKFYTDSAIKDGSCFFDSFRQGLKECKGIEVTVKQLRQDCLDFANNLANRTSELSWFEQSLSNSFDANANQLAPMTIDEYRQKIKLACTWGVTEREGRILCEKYDVKLNVIEKNTFPGLTPEFLGTRVSNKINEKVSDIDLYGNLSTYLDDNTIFIINQGEQHFEPLFNSSSQYVAKLLQEKEDFNLAKNLQVNEIVTYINDTECISLSDSAITKIEKILEKLLQQNKNGNIQDVVNKCVVQYFEQNNKENSHSELLFNDNSQQQQNEDYELEPTSQGKSRVFKVLSQEEEDVEREKTLQIKEIATHIKNTQHISLFDDLIAAIKEVFEKLLQQNKDGDIKDVVKKCVKHFEQNSNGDQHKPSCRMEETKFTPHFTQSLIVDCGR